VRTPGRGGTATISRKGRVLHLSEYKARPVRSDRVPEAAPYPLTGDLGQTQPDTPEVDFRLKSDVMEYKVLTERDSRFSGSFDPESHETTLNSYASEGWRVISGFTANSVWKSTKSQIMIVLERSIA
jgi:Domain of unknown function (DUF4177)